MSRPSWQDFGTHDESIVPELWDGVVGAWAPCLGPTGSRLHDMSKQSNWGTLTNMDNATDWVVSDGQYALDFDGADDRISAGTTGFSGLTQITIALWVRLNSGETEAMFFNARPTNTICNFFLFGTQVNLRGGSGTSLLWTVPAGFAGVWRHLVATIRGTTGTIFHNGVEVTQGTVTAIGASPTGLDLGAYSDFGAGYFLSGQMDDVTAWNRALSPNEIRQLHQLGRGGMYQRRRRSRIYIPQAGFQAAWARSSNVLLGFNQP